MTFEERYKGLNEKQRLAVDMIEGPLLVVAGPGSGKTEILSLRVGNILKQAQVLASNILCLTFTESAAANMRERLVPLIGQEAYRVAIHTFHNFCVEVIQKYPQYFYGGAFFSPADELSQVRILEEIFESLPADHPFSSYHPEQGYVYLRDVLQMIGFLKKAGLDPSEFRKILAHNAESFDGIDAALAGTLSERLTKENLAKVGEAAEKLSAEAALRQASFPSEFFPALSVVVTESLRRAVSEAAEIGRMTPLSAWKQKWLKKDALGQSRFKDSINQDKMERLAEIYERYRERMRSDGLYDFDDMILDVLSVLKNQPDLRYEIQEQYQYVLVDEFQDTNDAQMRLLRYLSDAPVHEGHPNIMAVGDDDQAVYKFQGAELSNILNFKKMFRDVAVVTLTDNYRSTQDILDAASHIIRKGEERLERVWPEIRKDLVSANRKIGSGQIVRRKFPTLAHEYHYVAKEIKRRLDNGETPENIAVIGRKHRQLEKLVPYLQSAGVPIRYEREQNVFQEPHIAQLIILSRFVATLADKDRDEADEYLPQILSFPFWPIKREDVWRISLAARRGGSEMTWLQAMLDSGQPELVKIADFLISLGVSAQNEPLEQVLDKMIDAFKGYYFSPEKFEHARAEYLAFLSSLRVFVNALREYKSGEVLSIRDLVEFVDLHEQNGISLNDQSPFAKLRGAVNLLTAHKAKGLEFDTVFVLSCQEEIWAGRKIPRKLSLPANLPVEPAGDTFDDQLRVFYVALTRAKRHLYLTSYEQDDSGEDSATLRFLIAEEGEKAVMEKESLRKIYFGEPGGEDGSLPEAHEALTASWLSYHTPPFIGSEEKLLKSLLENYQMPITHLNNFLDVEKGGPQYWLEQNLLHFPQAKTGPSAYGTAIHRALDQVSVYFKKEGRLPAKADVLDWFRTFLRRERLAKTDYEFYAGKGETDLGAYYEARGGTFQNKDLTEYDFREQGVFISGAHLSGKIDRITGLSSGQAVVLDYKTGKPLERWEESDPYKKSKALAYERQLLYYKILVENSRDLSGKLTIRTGQLDFIEPKGGEIISLALELTEDKAERLGRLAGIVFSKIQNLDLPDVGGYSRDADGSRAFEEDLLAGKI